jgi:hypothetical protein
MPGEIEGGYDREEEESVTPNPNNQAWPPVTHLPPLCNCSCAGNRYFPFGRRPFFSRSATWC